MAALAGVGWALSVAGWIASPMTSRLLVLLDFSKSEKLRELEATLLPQLALMLQQFESIPPGMRAQLERWTTRLRSALYHAEDILDVLDYERLHNQVITQSGGMRTFVRAKDIISGKTSELKKIINTLEKICEEGSKLLPPLSTTISNGANAKGNRSITTTSSALAQVIIGRDKERDEIVRTLKEPTGDCEPRSSSSNSKCYSVVGIYGIGGSGKTTLAQYVCDYVRMHDIFSPIMWIHVPQGFDVQRIYKEMLEAVALAATRDREAVAVAPHEYTSSLDTLQSKLKDELRGKRFLLVLDDVWAEKDAAIMQHKLDQLVSPLKDGSTGSKVLVTTRFKDAAMSLGAKTLIPIPDLSEDDLFSLLMHHALDGVSLDRREEEEQETFRSTGRKIARKLKGSPLAARVIGARLRNRFNTDFWKRISDQGVLNDTMGALWWSYQHLDVQVRRCFAYCSLFPQRYRFEREELIDLWTAQGFVIKATGSVDKTGDVGQDYFDELVSCSFLQATNVYGSKNKWFIIHDLLHELAAMVAGNDCFRVEGGEAKQLPPDVRHLFVRSSDETKVTEQICKLENLHTLILTTSFGGLGITIDELKIMTKRLKKLRVLHVDIQGCMVKIPARICKLKHLRFLRIHSPWSEKVHLPKKLDRMYHLQILELCGAGVLDFSKVVNVSHLVSLRDIRNSGFLFPNSNVPGFPGIGELKSLRELSDFRVRKDKGYELQQLKGMNHLRGRLRISGLESVESKDKALEAKLNDKKHLTSLSLQWSWSSPEQQFSCSPDLQVEILEGLCPPPQLTELEISQYGGSRYPNWMSSENRTGLFRSLQNLTLFQCHNLETLPEIGELFVHLRVLRLVVLPNLRRLPGLPDTLKSLEIRRCDALVVACQEDVDIVRSLFVDKASLDITTEEIDRFAGEQPDRFDRILSSIFGRCGSSLPPRLIRGHVRQEDYSQIMLPASVDRLIISYSYVTNTALQSCLSSCSASLASLNLRGLPFLTEIPREVMQSLAVLSDLSVEECLQFTHLRGLNHLSRLQHLSITKCPSIRALEEGDKVQALLGLAIDDIRLVPQLLSEEGCSSLWNLRIDGSQELREEEILQQLASLTSLDLSCCSWESLPTSLATLTSLEHLRLDYCKNIRFLPELPASLRSFELDDCNPLFVKSCQKAGDPNWQKITHVPTKRFSSSP
ncbi:hypothetical protein GUJ93_ZPchr0008g12309 [Zizania palustris]|uniref:AAA+ ATPase domain-containing protein n=1 Tax=Zizania palustris TaxID=103762 RepID=A0A8J5RBY5_ZIZPA|nr:hypothetical protein GUJ93_ZPchr0008g12309 [Zizania palustris]